MDDVARRAPRTLSIGGATYDLFVRAAKNHVKEGADGKELRLPVGGKIRVESVIETCGGGAANTSVGLRRLGFDAGFCGVIGSDQWGEALQRNFTKEGVDMSCVTLVQDEMTSFSVILSAGSGDRVIFYNSGTNTHLRDSTFDKAAAFDSNWIFLNHLSEESCIIEDDLLEILRSPKSPGLSWNPGRCHLERGMDHAASKALLDETDLLLLNKEEALTLTKETSIDAAFRHLFETKVRYVCITDASNGSYACDGRQIFHCPVDSSAPMVDTTGAGDAFGTGATWALLCGKTLPEMLLSGTINATSVLGAFGAQAALLTDTEMLSRLTSSALRVSVQPLTPTFHACHTQTPATN
jgi:sugar/nucleoside kinase (ribokinase family)